MAMAAWRVRGGPRRLVLERAPALLPRAVGARVLAGLKLQRAVEHARQSLAAGEAVVIYLQSTGESALEHALGDGGVTRPRAAAAVPVILKSAETSACIP